MSASPPGAAPFGMPGMPSMPPIPFNILDTLLPGYSMYAASLSALLGFDITFLFTVCALLFGLTKSANFLWAQLWRWVEGFGTSEVLIESDDVNSSLVRWLGRRGALAGARALVARKDVGVDPYGNPVGYDYVPSGAVRRRGGGRGRPAPGGPRQPEVTFDPAAGSYYFWYQRRLFCLTLGTLVGGHRHQYHQARLSCVGRSPAPIQALIAEAEAQHGDDMAACTVIKRANGQAWQVVATRPSRPLGSVILAPADKRRVIADIEDYLRPETAQWYSDRGIPYRRGYLLHGPPGTGKSSLSFALAGLFRLELFCISLQEPTLTEMGLNQLFQTLPPSCVVLLEDIDQAGLVRHAPADDAKSPPGASDDADSDFAQPLPSARSGARRGLRPPGFEWGPYPPGMMPNAAGGNISLSGLLNVIDGVASHEGRVLIMTTNHVERLDAALVRPGRIDQQIRFTLATRQQIHELFVRMYQPVKPRLGGRADAEAGGKDRVSEEGRKGLAEVEPVKAKEMAFDPARVEAAATAFAEACPAEAFSPAEIQGYLLTKKQDPETAVAGAAEWVEEALKKKESEQ